MRRMRELHAGAQRHVSQVRHLRRHDGLQLEAPSLNNDKGRSVTRSSFFYFYAHWQSCENGFRPGVPCNRDDDRRPKIITARAASAARVPRGPRTIPRQRHGIRCTSGRHCRAYPPQSPPLRKASCEEKTTPGASPGVTQSVGMVVSRCEARAVAALAAVPGLRRRAGSRRSTARSGTGCCWPERCCC